MDFYITVCIVLFTQLILFLILKRYSQIKSYFVVDCVLCRGEMTTCFKSLVKSGSACLRVVFLLFNALSNGESSADCADGSEACNPGGAAEQDTGFQS